MDKTEREKLRDLVDNEARRIRKDPKDREELIRRAVTKAQKQDNTKSKKR